MLKKHTAILALTTLLLNGSFALAEAPTSQFGFSDWPYRNESSCAASTTLPQVNHRCGRDPHAHGAGNHFARRKRQFRSFLHHLRPHGSLDGYAPAHVSARRFHTCAHAKA